ncbi:MAG: S46 family peptidase, partial [Planctomycetia bacterium]|nr:S46 family peptidase [Planctomycetia bacterium]
MVRRPGSGAMAVMFMLCGIAAVVADEGMWLTECPPRERLKQRYDFDCNDEWMEHLRRSSVRFNNGGSGSFCSKDGLVVTNHHVGAAAAYKLSTPQRNYLKDGFYARTRDEELQCHDLELNVLYDVEDVTGRVQEAVREAESDRKDAAEARRAVIATIEQEATGRTGLRC